MTHAHPLSSIRMKGKLIPCYGEEQKPMNHLQHYIKLHQIEIVIHLLLNINHFFYILKYMCMKLENTVLEPLKLYL